MTKSEKLHALICLANRIDREAMAFHQALQGESIQAGLFEAVRSVEHSARRVSARANYHLAEEVNINDLGAENGQ
jgi:hypothetical protein